MIAIDTNLLVYAHRSDSPWHAQAKQCLERLASSRTWAIPWPCLHEFLAIVTHPRIFQPATPLPVAMEAIAEWLKAPTLSLLSEGDGYWARLSALATSAKVVGPRIHDARVAALCLAHGIDELWSADRDFGRFPELAVRNPLV